MWLHHTLHVIDEDHATDRLVLITACPCGDYTYTPLRDDDALESALQPLTRLRTTGTCECTRTPLATHHDGEQRILTPLHTLEDAIAHLTYDTCEDAARRAAGRAQVLDKSGGLLTDARRWRGYEAGGASCYLAPGLVLYYRPTDHQYGHEYLLESAERDQSVSVTSLAQLREHLIARADGTRRPAREAAAPSDAA